MAAQLPLLQQLLPKLAGCSSTLQACLCCLPLEAGAAWASSLASLSIGGCRCSVVRRQHTQACSEVPAAAAVAAAVAGSVAARSWRHRRAFGSCSSLRWLSSDAGDGANAQARALTRLVRGARDLQELRGLVEQRGAALNAIHAAAAFGRVAKLAGADRRGGAGNADAARLLELLRPKWEAVLAQAAPREMAGVLLACAKLRFDDSKCVWAGTVSALLEQQHRANSQDLSNVAWALAASGAPGLPRELTEEALRRLTGQLLERVGADPDLTAQSLSSMLWACAKLGVQPEASQLTALLRAMARPELLRHAEPQAVANVLWALSELQQLPDWPASELGQQKQRQRQRQQRGQHQHQQQQQQQQAEQDRLWSQLLGGQQLAKVACGGPQALSTTLLALGRLSSPPAPGGRALLGVPFAQQCASALLAGPAAQDLSEWNGEDVGSSMWACARLGLRDPPFLERVAAAAPGWLPGRASASAVNRVAWACAKLKFRHAQLVAELMLRGRQLLHRQPGSATHAPLLPDQHERTGLAATLSGAAAALNLTELAGDVKALLAASSVKHQCEPLDPSHARTLWRVHNWLVSQRLLGGHGLLRPGGHGLLTEQQLAACAAASRHTFRRTPPPPPPPERGQQ